MFGLINTSNGNQSEGNLLSKILRRLRPSVFTSNPVDVSLCRIEHKFSAPAVLLGVLNLIFGEILKTSLELRNGPIYSLNCRKYLEVVEVVEVVVVGRLWRSGRGYVRIQNSE